MTQGYGSARHSRLGRKGCENCDSDSERESLLDACECWILGIQDMRDGRIDAYIASMFGHEATDTCNIGSRNFG